VFWARHAAAGGSDYGSRVGSTDSGVKLDELDEIVQEE
jgi:hypothetical protein